MSPSSCRDDTLLRLVLREPGALDELRSCDALVSSELIAVESGLNGADGPAMRELFVRRDGRVVDGGGLEKLIRLVFEFATFAVKSARSAGCGVMAAFVLMRPVRPVVT